MDTLGFCRVVRSVLGLCLSLLTPILVSSLVNNARRIHVLDVEVKLMEYLNS